MLFTNVKLSGNKFVSNQAILLTNQELAAVTNHSNHITKLLQSALITCPTSWCDWAITPIPTTTPNPLFYFPNVIFTITGSLEHHRHLILGLIPTRAYTLSSVIPYSCTTERLCQCEQHCNLHRLHKSSQHCTWFNLGGPQWTVKIHLPIRGVNFPWQRWQCQLQREASYSEVNGVCLRVILPQPNNSYFLKPSET